MKDKTLPSTMNAWPTNEHVEIRQRIAAHQKADEIIQGSGWADGKGCAIGCSLDRYDHEEYARVVLGNNDRNDGIKLARLIDRLHEGQDIKAAVKWPGRVARALKPGADTSLVLARWFVWLLATELKNHDKAGHCARVAALYQRRVSGDDHGGKEWRSAASAAASAAANASAYAATEAAAYVSASSSAYAAAAAASSAAASDAAADAADAAAASATEAAADASAAASAAHAARLESYERMADKLITIMYGTD